MRDGATRELSRSGEGSNAFVENFRVTLVIVSGGAEGTEFELVGNTVLVGRGPGVDFAIDDASMSQEHAAFELARDGYRIRDLNSTNGTRVNGETSGVADLKHGDRIELGEHVFQYVVEPLERGPRVFSVPE
jgi:pSer/pThr/pTyr-binding forkhead associated (FHA) protein